MDEVPEGAGGNSGGAPGDSGIGTPGDNGVGGNGSVFGLELAVGGEVVGCGNGTGSGRLGPDTNGTGVVDGTVGVGGASGIGVTEGTFPGTGNAFGSGSGPASGGGGIFTRLIG